MDSKTLNPHPISSTSASKLLFASPAPSCQPPLPPRFDHLDHLRSMSCSLPNTHGTSDWLSRLRSSRGFPDTDNMGFEQHRCSIKEDDSETCTGSVLLKTPGPDKPEDGEDMQGRDDNLPSELFNIGDCHDLSRIKRNDTCRTQQCPEIFVESKNSDGNSLLAPLTSHHKRKRTVRTVKKVDQDFKVADPVEEEEKGHLDLLGCSQTEFTVIDSSLPSWKFEKMLHRRKKVLKVGDKKRKGSKRRDRNKSLNQNSEVRLRDDDNLSRIKSKKTNGKQRCPRTCAVSKRSDTVSSPWPVTLTWSRKRKRTAKKVNRELKVADCVEEEDKGYLDLKVIDASPPSWKYGKMLYRNKNVWRDGDEGLMSRDRKKGKKSLNENGDGQKKKLKRDASSAKLHDAKEGCEKQKNLNMCNSVKYVDKGKAMVRSKCAQGHDQGKVMTATSEKKQDNCSQVQEKRVLKKQIDGGSSVILIKSIPITNKKDMSGTSKSCAKLQK